jgi:hypothetical protein
VFALGACCAVAVLLASGCGQGSRQDAHEPAGTFAVAIVKASFPARQAIATPSKLELQVRNTGARTAPNVAVTLDSLNYTDTAPDLGANKRPVWIVDQGPGTIPKRPAEGEAVAPPGSGQSAFVNTWTLGPLAPGRTQTFVWRVTPVRSGVHTVHFTIAAGVNGKAHAQLGNGSPPTGHFTVRVAPVPAATHVDPQTGQVVSGTFPSVP